MPKNDEGEFEMMLGNKQLLSVFFIVIVLLGVFFVMGYIVGRSSTPGKSELASTASGTVNPAPSPTPRSLPPREVASEPAPPTEPAPARAEPQPIVEKPRTETAEPAPVEERRPTAAAPPSGPDMPPPGSYWQVAAVKRPEGELLVEMLARKGYKARLAVAPGTDGLLRVLVGPAAGTPALSALKSQLEEAGYKQPIMRNY